MRRGLIVAIAATGVTVLGAGGFLFRDRLQDAFLEPQIVGGEDVPQGAFANVVGLTYGTERTPRCGGVLIAPTMVLAAAHCVCAQRPSHVFVGVDATDQRPATRGAYYRVTDSRAALRCGQESSAEGVDIAVIEVSPRIAGVTAVGLAPDALIDRARQYRIVGYGATDLQGQVFTHEKQQAAVDSRTNTCRGVGEAERFGCVPGEVVAGRAGGGDTCTADSGGPLLVSPAGDAGPLSGAGVLVAGVASRGVKPAPTRCGQGGVYERLQPRLRTWIAAAMESMARS